MRHEAEGDGTCEEVGDGFFVEMLEGHVWLGLKADASSVVERWEVDVGWIGGFGDLRNRKDRWD